MCCIPQNWGYKTLLILEDHYTTTLQNILSELSAPGVEGSFCGRQDVIEHAEALIASFEEGPGDQVVTEEDKHGH